MGSIAALWISMSASIPTYMLASSLIGFAVAFVAFVAYLAFRKLSR